MIETDLRTVAEVVGGTLVDADGSETIRGVGIDTRDDLSGRCFVAIRGERHDGHDHLPAAFDAGAAAAIVAEDTVPTGPRVVVKDTIVALADLARWHRGRLRGPVVGVTGSAGKTTTRALLEAVLAPLGRGTASIKSFNNHIGVPLTLLAASPEDRWVVLEMGTSGPGEIPHLVSIAGPEVAVITTIGRSHLEALGDRAGVAREKATILDGASFAVVNVDQDPMLPELAARRGAATRVVTVGSHERADRRLRSRAPLPDGGQRLEIGDGDDSLSTTLALDGPHNAANALAAIEVARHLGVADDDIATALAGVEPPAMRFVRRRVGGVEILDDAYNANPDSMAASLAAFDEIAGTRRRILVLGAMLELGEDAVAMHREVGGIAAGIEPTHLVTVGDLGDEIAAGAAEAGLAEGIHRTASADEAATLVATLVADGDAVLVKASRGVGLEVVSDTLRDRWETTA